MLTFNYAATLNNAGEFDKAEEIIIECEKYIYDYNVCMLKGNLEYNRNKLKEACKKYKEAHNMCPSKITPMYELFLIYKEIGYTKSADSIREQILSMKPKVENQQSQFIYKELKNK